MTLTVRNGSFSYPGSDRPILRNVDLSVEPGQILAILGPNGAGKTTLLRCITGMLRWTEGESLLDGEPIRGMAPRKLWSRMAYVPQARTASGAYTAFETVLLGRSSRLGAFSAPGKEDLRKAREVMELLGIESLADRKCSAISGGELQMVLIARALASEPRILILDEPESNLDFKNQLVVLDTMSALAARGMACIFNTHYPAHALQRSDRALILSRGGEYTFGSTAQVVTEASIRRSFGVEAVIGDVETPTSIIRDVIPLHIAAGEDREPDQDRRSIATVTVIAPSNAMADRINGLLHDCADMVVGRMGMPYREAGLYLITVTLDGSRARIRELSQRLGLLPEVSVKTTFAREELLEGGNK